MTEVLRSLIRADVARWGYRPAARLLMIEHSQVWRWLNTDQEIVSEHVDAIVATYGIRRIVGEFNRLRKGLA
jgi:hypothetical protein